MSKKILSKSTATCTTKGGKIDPPQHVQKVGTTSTKNNVENGTPGNTHLVEPQRPPEKYWQHPRKEAYRTSSPQNTNKSEAE